MYFHLIKVSLSTWMYSSYVYSTCWWKTVSPWFWTWHPAVPCVSDVGSGHGATWPHLWHVLRFWVTCHTWHSLTRGVVSTLLDSWLSSLYDLRYNKLFYKLRLNQSIYSQTDPKWRHCHCHVIINVQDQISLPLRLKTQQFHDKAVKTNPNIRTTAPVYFLITTRHSPLFLAPSPFIL